jgi:hypothetical protein
MRKKLRLSLDTLEVESFTAMPDRAQRGTVGGYATELATCDDATCEATCDDYTCFNSCQGQGTCVGCGTNFGPNCATQKQTGPCGAC